MRILVAIAHYFGPRSPEASSPLIASQFEPVARIAALNETLVTLHRSFGRSARTAERIDLSPAGALTDRKLDIVVITHRDHNLLPYVGIDPSHYDVEYVDEPLAIPFRAPQVMRERLGDYDFYCFLEDDELIHDGAFFEKLAWFQAEFGTAALLMPARYEMPSSGTLTRVIIDPRLSEHQLAPFRRPGQRDRLQGIWRGHQQAFALPSNPHAGGYFLTAEQMSYWAGHPTFGDGDTSWVGPLESAVTLSVGKVFDIYKPVEPDPFFLCIQHHGTRYAVATASAGEAHGDSPLIGITQGALRSAASGEGDKHSVEVPQGLDRLIDLARTQPTIGELDRINRRINALERAVQQSLRERQNTDERIRTLSEQVQSFRAEVGRLSRVQRRMRRRGRRPGLLRKLHRWLATMTAVGRPAREKGL